MEMTSRFLNKQTNKQTKIFKLKMSLCRKVLSKKIIPIKVETAKIMMVVYK